MTTDQFTWDAVSASRSIKPNVYTAAFGDGYEQNAPKGINFMPETWTLQFKPKSQAVAESIVAFLKSMGAYQKFTWTPPNSTVQSLWLCKEFQDKKDPGNVTMVTATFVQQFGV